MPTIDAGIFLILMGMAFAFSFISFRVNSMYEVILRLFAMILFFVLALFMVAEYDVIYTQASTDGTSTWTTSNTLIGATNESGGFQIIGMVFLIFGVTNAGLLFHFMTEYNDFKKENEFYER